jgi:hypothetical protein
VNPDPAAVLAIAATSVAASIVLVAIVVTVAVFVVPRLEGWLARRSSPLLAALAASEDAALPWEAKQRARRLFLERLDEGQRRAWLLRRRCSVRSSTGRRYTLAPYRPFNIRSGDALFCIQVHGRIPVYDKLLAQKLLIEADEELFLARANVRALSPVWSLRVAAARARYPAEV